MSKERRYAPRKACAVPIRFRVLSDVFASKAAPVQGFRSTFVADRRSPSIADGEVVNLSERGIYFKSSNILAVGEAIEIYLKLPRELTGRAPEDVRCDARVVHVDPSVNGNGAVGIGATIERFETVGHQRGTWDN
jgi:hypothetical protein